MIKCEKGNVIMEGACHVILSEVAVVLKAARKMAAEAYEDGEFADELIGKALQMSRMPDAEVQKYRQRMISSFFEGGGI